MFADYAPLIAPVVAVLNGVIAVAVAQFKPEDNGTKYGLLAGRPHSRVRCRGSDNLQPAPDRPEA
jgi:hypothetical protein